MDSTFEFKATDWEHANAGRGGPNKIHTLSIPLRFFYPGVSESNPSVWMHIGDDVYDHVFVGMSINIGILTLTVQTINHNNRENRPFDGQVRGL